MRGEFMKNAIAGPREVVGHVVHGRHQSTVSERQRESYTNE
jgi:hypothetical protein